MAAFSPSGFDKLRVHVAHPDLEFDNGGDTFQHEDGLLRHWSPLHYLPNFFHRTWWDTKQHSREQNSSLDEVQRGLVSVTLLTETLHCVLRLSLLLSLVSKVVVDDCGQKVAIVLAHPCLPVS